MEGRTSFGQPDRKQLEIWPYPKSPFKRAQVEGASSSLEWRFKPWQSDFLSLCFLITILHSLSEEDLWSSGIKSFSSLIRTLSVECGGKGRRGHKLYHFLTESWL